MIRTLNPEQVRVWDRLDPDIECRMRLAALDDKVRLNFESMPQLSLWQLVLLKSGVDPDCVGLRGLGVLLRYFHQRAMRIAYVDW